MGQDELDRLIELNSELNKHSLVLSGYQKVADDYESEHIFPLEDAIRTIKRSCDHVLPDGKSAVVFGFDTACSICGLEGFDLKSDILQDPTHPQYNLLKK